MNSLKKPLSQWTRFLARLLGAFWHQTPSQKKTHFKKILHFLKYILYIPFVPTVIVSVVLVMLSQNGLVPLDQKELSYVTKIVLLIDISVALLCYAYNGSHINAFGILAMLLKFIGLPCYALCDNLYQNICLKLFNKNFKKYPFKEMLKNREGILRRENALNLSNRKLIIELCCCVKLCDAKMIQDVLKWCNGSSDRLKYNHLEELRGHVLSQYKNHGAYKKACSNVEYKNTFGGLYNEMDEIMSVYALRNQLEAASNSAETMRHSPRKLRKI